MTIDPRPCSIVVGRAARIVRNVEVRSPSRTAPPRRCHLVGRLWLPVSAGERGEQVDRSELLGKDGEGVLQRAGVGLIGRRRHGTAAVGPDPVHDLLDRGDVAATDADEGPMAGQPDPSRGPDPARSAGDHRDPPSQPGHLLHRVGHHAPSFPDPLRDLPALTSNAQSLAPCRALCSHALTVAGGAGRRPSPLRAEHVPGLLRSAATPLRSVR